MDSHLPAVRREPHAHAVAALTTSFFLILFVSACIPVNYYDRDSRTNMDTDVVNTIVPGTTTMADMLLAFGEPESIGAPENLTSECVREFEYNWERIHWLCFCDPKNLILPLGKTYILRVKFGENDTVTSRGFNFEVQRLTKFWY
jgi:hypothetical protein